MTHHETEAARFRLSRRGWLLTALVGAVGCGGEATADDGGLELVWGTAGRDEGQLNKPRAIAIDAKDQLYIVDMTARIQVFDRDGTFLRYWRTPASHDGRPSGLTFDRNGNLMVADTHYFRVLFYTASGELLEQRTIGGTNGYQPGQFNFVTDAVQDSQDNFYIGEYGEFNRIQKFDPAGQFLFQWAAEPGTEPGQLIRPQNLDIDDQDRVWVADSCNHRIQVFDATGSQQQLVACWGKHGREVGELDYPYDLALDGKGHLYICEYGNHRVQKFTTGGKLVASWGRPGRAPGELHQPWACALDSQGSLHVLDSLNHRVQRIRL